MWISVLQVLRSPFRCREFQTSRFAFLIVSRLSHAVVTDFVILQTSALLPSMMGHGAAGSSSLAASVLERLASSVRFQVVEYMYSSCLYLFSRYCTWHSILVTPYQCLLTFNSFSFVFLFIFMYFSFAIANTLGESLPSSSSGLHYAPPWLNVYLRSYKDFLDTERYAEMPSNSDVETIYDTCKGLGSDTALHAWSRRWTH